MMPLVSKKEQERAEGVLDDLLACEGGLSGKEIDFIEDMDNKRNINWTGRQVEWLDIIYRRVC
jgi:hypothetical protein